MKKILIFTVTIIVSFAYSQTNQKTLYFNKFAIDNESYEDVETEATFLWENKNAIKLNINSTFIYFGIMDSKYGTYDDEGDKFDAYFVENLHTEEQAIIYLYHNLKYGMRVKQEDGSSWYFHHSSHHLDDNHSPTSPYEEANTSYEVYEENQAIKETLIQEELNEDLETERQAMGADPQMAEMGPASRIYKQRPEYRGAHEMSTATLGSDNDISLTELDKSWLGKQYDNLVENKEITLIVGIIILFIIIGVSRNKT